VLQMRVCLKLNSRVLDQVDIVTMLTSLTLFAIFMALINIITLTGIGHKHDVTFSLIKKNLVRNSKELSKI